MPHVTIHATTRSCGDSTGPGQGGKSGMRWNTERTWRFSRLRPWQAALVTLLNGLAARTQEGGGGGVGEGPPEMNRGSSLRRSVRLAGTALVAATVAATVLTQVVLLAAERPPLLHGLYGPLAAPQEYWICVARNENGSCRMWKTCIKWQGGECQKWVYVSETGWFYCGAGGCPVIHGAHRPGGSISAESLADQLDGTQAGARNRPDADRGRPIGVSPPGDRFVVLEGHVESAAGARMNVRVVIAAEPRGGVILVRASSHTCGPSDREALASVASWASRSASSRVAWVPGGCTVTVSHRGLDEWLQRLQAVPDQVGPDGHGGAGEQR